MSTIIYGLDIESNFNAKDALKAMSQCLLEAHAEVLNDLVADSEEMSPEEIESLKVTDVEMLMMKFLAEVGGDRDNPTKENLMALAEKLRTFSANFRKEQIVEKHHKEMTSIIAMLP